MKYEKDLKVLAEYDVIVSGGGPAGFCAAVQSARLGLKTALVEQHNMLGGALTSGGNTEIALFFAGSKQIISGIGWEFATKLAEKGWATIPEFQEGIYHAQQAVSVNGPMAAAMMDKMCLESGVVLYLLQEVIDVIATEASYGKKIEGIVISTQEGLSVLKTKVIVDCTGDGKACAMAGAKYELGDSVTKELQPGTLRFYLTGYDLEEIDQNQVEAAFLKARENNELLLGDFWPESSGSPYEIFRSYGNNINHIYNLNGADSKTKTIGEIEGRKSVERIMQWARKNVKGAQKLEALSIGNEVCVRESRRILCDKYITVEDYLSAKLYEDSVSYTYYPVDLHTSDNNALENIFLEKGKVPKIPLGAMLPIGFENLLVAGRCISADRLAMSAIRVKASCMAMGQAAGAAAAISASTGKRLRELDIENLKNTLENFGAIVPVE